MSHIRKKLKLYHEAGVDNLQKQQDIPPAAPCARFNLEDPSATGREQERLLHKQQTFLQQFCLTQNGNGAMYEWYKDCVYRRVEGTCNWFLQHDDFLKWMSQESGSLLVSADPGCGKSVLAKYLIDDGLAKQSATICYFFFKDQDQNTIRQALCALLHQLFSQKSVLIQHAMENYSNLGATLAQSETLLWTILRDAVRDPQAGPVIFVIDALDECDESQLSSLITNVEDLFRHQQMANAKFKVLMTSRPYQQVVNEFHRLRGDFQRAHVSAEEELDAISQDINSVIHHRVDQLAEKHQLSDKIKSSLNSKLLAIDHHTYLWVCPMLDYLDEEFDKGLKTVEGIDAAIHTLPLTVSQAYEHILNRSQDDETVKTIKKALSIILAQRRPLTLSEMNFAMSLNDQGRRQSIYDLKLERDVDFKSRLRALCGLFVNVRHDKVYFLHQTARDFLIQSSTPTPVSSDLKWHLSITTRHAHSVLAEVCLFHLDMLNSTDTKIFFLGGYHDNFLRYSIEHWGDHCREADLEKGSAMVELASRLCTPDLSSHSQWASIISSRYHIRHESLTNVLVSSRLGLTPVTDFLLSSGADIEVKDSWGSTALILAAESGHEAVARLLLENGADVETKDGLGRTALMHATELGHEAVARLLLKYGAEAEARDDEGWTALIYAAIYRQEAVARLLLVSSADIEVVDYRGWTALIHAARSGHEAVTRLLLEKGANVEARDDDGGTALIYAAGRGYEAVTRLLIDKCVDVKWIDHYGWAALIHAARYGHEAVARLLLDNGADVEAKLDNGSTALMFAVVYCHESVIRLLLYNGANIEARDDYGRTALIHAIESDHEAATRLLLEKGADVEAKDGFGWTALLFATRYGLPVTRLLLEYGADVEAKDGSGRTALVYAVIYRHEAVTRLLLDNNANVEAKLDSGPAVLLYATANGHESTMRLLLDSGADIEARSCDGSTALMLAVDRNNNSTAQLLLGYGADANAKKPDGLTALMLATGASYHDTILLLLENGADIEARDNLGRTALFHAVSSCYVYIVRLLLENGADIEARDNHGFTALMLAAEGVFFVARLLLANGADVGARSDYGMTALMLASRSGHEAIARLLLRKGAGVEAKNDGGSTALILAAAKGHIAVTRLLLRKGADVEAKDDLGTTALMFAAESGHEAVTRLLIENGADVKAKDNNGWTALRNAPEATSRLLLDNGAQVEPEDVEESTA